MNPRRYSHIGWSFRVYDYSASEDVAFVEVKAETFEDAQGLLTALGLALAQWKLTLAADEKPEAQS